MGEDVKNIAITHASTELFRLLKTYLFNELLINIGGSGMDLL